ncbi:MAG: U32 family peptidase [Rhodospirillaceae bacterium]|nr:U32 family peptidase [Rhodospirillaceae bacterium]
MTKASAKTAKLTLGPLLFNWSNDKRRDMYFRVADETDIDTVVLGEVVCSKRTPFQTPLWPEVIDRLTAAGKEVVFSTQALILSSREMSAMRDLVSDETLYFEANDIAVDDMLKGRRHMIGPMMNVYNEGTLATLAANGADRICVPVELSGAATGVLAASGIMEVEAFVFGRMPLAIAARCYHARAHNLAKDTCKYVCNLDADGMTVDTLDGKPFLAVNGTQTMSYTVANLAAEIPALLEMGVSRFRISPHDVDIVHIANLFRGVITGTTDPAELLNETDGLIDGAPNSNGFFYDVEGLKYKTAE